MPKQTCFKQQLQARFELFLKQLDAGWEKMHTCEELAQRLTKSNHPESGLIQETQDQLRY